MSSLHFSSVRPPFQAPGLWPELSVDLGSGWTAVVGPNGTGKTTFLRLACGALAPSSGQVVGPHPRLLVPQVPFEAPGSAAGPWEWPEGRRWASLLEVEDDWWQRWPTLSSGERQRGLLAWCLAQEPAVLALDEPTNHLDEPARRLIVGALARYEGVGLVASHDEAVLEALADRVLWLGSSRPWVEQGPWAVVRQEKRRRDQEAADNRALQRKRMNRLEAEDARRRHEAHQADALKNTKRGLDPKDHDGKARVNGARVSGKDGVQAHQAALWRRRLEGQAQEPEGGPVKRGMRVSAGEAPRFWSALRLIPGDRVVVTGPNGCGKSTWLKAQVAADDPRVAYLSQEVGPDEARALVRSLAAGDGDRDGWLARAARWGLDPVKVLQTPAPSPGEVQKLRLAGLGLGDPGVLALDEPTNHLDLEAKELLADTLGGFEGIILLVSHDRAWWSRLGFREVRFEELPLSSETGTLPRTPAGR